MHNSENFRIFVAGIIIIGQIDMKYTYEYTIRYMDVDDTKHLRWVALEEYLLEVAGTVADELGFGIAVLHPRDLTWIITHLALQMTYMPMPQDRIVIETWIEQNAHMLSTRDYRIYLIDRCAQREKTAVLKEGSRENWRLIGECKSVWAVLNMEKREIVNIFDDPMFVGAVDGEVLPLPRAPRMMALPEAPRVPYTIRYSDLDYNRHFNSCKYLQAMLDAYLPSAFKGWMIGLGKAVSGEAWRLDVHYSREVYFGEQITIAYQDEDDLIRYQLLNAEGLTSCSATLLKI